MTEPTITKKQALYDANAQKLADDLSKLIGGNDSHVEIQGWLDTGYPPLNERLSGNPDLGLPYGRIVEVYGDSGTGKTAWAVDLIIRAQKLGGAGMLMDHERAFNLDLAVGNGLNPNSPFWIYKQPETFEESNHMAMKAAEMIRKAKVIAPEAPIVVVFDSVAAMIPQSVLYDPKNPKVRREITKLNMNDTTALSRVASSTLKIVNQIMGELNVITIYLNQIRTKVGVVWGDPTTTPGGSAFKFLATTRLELSRKMEKDAAKDVTGQIVNFHTKKNRMERPFQDIEMLLVFPKTGGAFWDTTSSLLGELVGMGKLTIKTLGNGSKRVTWAGEDYTLTDFTAKVKAEGLYPQMVELYKSGAMPSSAPVVVTEDLNSALAAL